MEFLAEIAVCLVELMGNSKLSYDARLLVAIIASIAGLMTFVIIAVFLFSHTIIAGVALSVVAVVWLVLCIVFLRQLTKNGG